MLSGDGRQRLVAEGFEDVVAVFEQLAREREACAVAADPRGELEVVGAVGYTCLDAAALWAACAATGHHLGFLAVLIACCIGYLTATIPVPAGLGVLDAGLAGALVLYGLHPAASVGAVLVYHAVSVWVPGCGGMVGLLSTRRIPITDHPPIAAPRLAEVQLAEVAQAKR